MAGVPERVAALGPTIEKLMSIGGTAGLSLGILQHGKPIYHANYGFRNVQEKLPMTEDTIVPGCSLAKAMTAASIALLVEENKLTWDTRLKDILPEFGIKDDILRNHTTVEDLLCHRTGMSWGDNYYISSENNVIIPGKAGMKYLNSQEPISPFRGQFRYNNLHYELAGYVIEKISGEKYSDFVTSRLTQPIGMPRTSFKSPQAGTDNVATCYNVLDDGTPTAIPCVKAGDDGFGASSGGIRSCVTDLLRLYGVFLASANDQFANERTSTKDSPLKQVNYLMSAKMPMSQPTRSETSYAFGWARTQLPGRMGAIGCNPGLMPSGMPIVGKGAPSQLVIYHQGSLPGALAAVVLLPDTESAIVVLTNTLSLNDTPDWVSQLVLEEMLEVPDKNDYVAAATTSVAQNAKWYSDTREELSKSRKTNTSPKKLEEYIGTYWDAIHVVKIEVSLEEGNLHWALQGLPSEKFSLEHYENDTFTWLQPRNELAKRGRWVDQGADFWKLRFEANSDGEIEKVFWVHDVGVPAVEYRKIVKVAL
ncbi:hypothetical protein G7Y79_00059g091780 [Physcia stellaris]|nr:hypothetical protein G7Y79_00059g091780 [Physcia stellaris]